MAPDPVPTQATPAGGFWVRLCNLFWAAADGMVAYPLRNVVLIAAVAVGLFPLISAVAIAEGLRLNAQQTLRSGADLFVAGNAFGVDAPVSRERQTSIAALPGVEAVVPRIVGRVNVADSWMTVVGLDAEAMAGVPVERRGTVPELGQIMVGSSVSEELGFRAGKRVMLEAGHTLVFQVAQVFDQNSGVGSVRTIVMNLADATDLFQEEQLVSDLLVYCRSGYSAKLAEMLSKDSRLRVQTQQLVSRYLDRAYHLRSGAFLMMVAFALVLAVPVFLLLADVGGGSRRKEIGILKASGWTTQEVLWMNLIENWLIAIAAGVFALLLAVIYVWGAGAIGLRGIFVPGSFGTHGQLDLPFRFSGLAVTLSFLAAAILTTVAGILSVWRSSIISPSAAMRTP